MPWWGKIWEATVRITLLFSCALERRKSSPGNFQVVSDAWIQQGRKQAHIMVFFSQPETQYVCIKHTSNLLVYHFNNLGWTWHFLAVPSIYIFGNKARRRPERVPEGCILVAVPCLISFAREYLKKFRFAILSKRSNLKDVKRKQGKVQTGLCQLILRILYLHRWQLYICRKNRLLHNPKWGKTPWWGRIERRLSFQNTKRLGMTLRSRPALCTALTACNTTLRTWFDHQQGKYLHAEFPRKARHVTILWSQQISPAQLHNTYMPFRQITFYRLCHWLEHQLQES